MSLLFIHFDVDAPENLSIFEEIQFETHNNRLE